MQTAERKYQLEEFRPESRGIYHADEVAAYITVADAPFHASPVSVRASTVRGWIRRGLVSYGNPDDDRGPKYVRFGDLVTCRMVAMMLSFGTLPASIKRVHDWMADANGCDRPFIKREFWTESPGMARSLQSGNPELFDLLNRRGKLPLLDSLDRRLHDACRMDFGDETGLPLRWYPVDGVAIEPQYVSGRPTLIGRNVATHYIPGSYTTDDEKKLTMDWYEITEAQLETAVTWESQLDDAGVLRWL